MYGTTVKIVEEASSSETEVLYTKLSTQFIRTATNK